MDILQTHKLKRLPAHCYYFCKYTIRTLINLNLGIYWLWVGVRILLTLLPQTGYIHPDEYFQTVEVFAGNAFNLEVSIPWEFNVSFPVRSIPLLYTTIYLPLSFLRKISELFEFYLGFNLINHYTLLITPRFSMCLISFISDICLFKICYHFGQNYKERLIIYGSSFVCLVFMTRTFSNTLEITCFNILLCLVALCMAESEKVTYQNDFLQDKYNEASTIPDQVKVLKLMKLLPKHSLNRCIAIAVVTVSGFFNRPTFLFFAFTPLFYWFQRGLNVRSTFLKDFHIRLFVFVLHCIPIICFFIYFDSAYYGYITWGEILNLKVSSNNFVVTPLNFVKYNMNPSNLAKHGIHPRFLHLFVNVPLLFNVLGISGMLVVAKMVYRSGLSNWTLLPKSQSITGMMTLSFLVPVIGLSIFPHQEPRFITPILLPLVFLYSHLIRNFEEDCKSVIPFRKRHPKRKQISGIFKYPLKCIDFFERATENFDNRYNLNGRYLAELKQQKIVKQTSAPVSEATHEQDEEEKSKTPEKEETVKKESKKSNFMKLWYFFNGFCFVFFGLLHQGGIYGLSKDFHEKLLVKPKYTTYHLITSHSYSFPVHLLSLKKNFKGRNTNFVAHELGTENFETINIKIISILKMAESKKKSLRRNYRVFYALPTSIFHDFAMWHFYFAANYTYEIQNIFYPHLSTEALPHLALNVTGENNFRLGSIPNSFTIFDCMPLRYLIELFHQFGLMLVQVTLPEQ